MRFALASMVCLAAIALGPPAKACLLVGPPTHKIKKIDDALADAKLKPEERAEVIRLRDKARELSSKPNHYEANRAAETALGLLGIKPPAQTTRC